jgi:hypothetical protein
MGSLLSVLLKRPAVSAVLGALTGLLLGLIIGWWIWPVQWSQVPPSLLGPEYQQEYLRMTIDSFRVNGDPNLAMKRWEDLGQDASRTFLNVQQDPGKLDPAVILTFGDLVESVQGPMAGDFTQDQAQSPSPVWTIIISVGGILALGVVLFGVIFFIRNIYRPRSGTVTAAMQAAEVTRQTERTDFESLGLAPPVTQTMTTYVLGDDLYDESFSIDTQGGDFLGEYGVGVSETIGVGEPKKVTALEIWLFDKNDIKTATKVLMSTHAFNDMNLRSRLEAKGELVMLEPDEQIVLETATLQLLVTVSDLDYGEGAMPPESYFERVTLEMAVWPKDE